MKKIIAIWLSINLLVLQGMPVAAQIVPFRQVPKGLKAPKVNIPVGNPAGAALLNQQLAKAARTNMRLQLTTQHTALLPQQTYVPVARQILTHANAVERALLLRTDFTALALNHQVQPADITEGAKFYRTNLTEHKNTPVTETVADIASLGLLGERADGALILQVAQKAIGTPQEAAVTAAAARALLRLEAYDALETLQASSRVQPELWDGIREYAQQYNLPVDLSAQAQRETVDVSALQADLMELGPINSLVVMPSVDATYLYMNAGEEAPLANAAVTPADAAAKADAPAPWHETYQRLAQQALTEEAVLPEADAATPKTPAFNKAAGLLSRPDRSPWHETYQRLARQALAEEPVAAEGAAAALTAQPTPAARAAAFTKVRQWIARAKQATGEDESSLVQRAALYLTAFSIGLEIGTPIMASIKSALNLPLSYAILVTVASYSPYLFGSFIANWLKGKIGRKNTINTGLALMGGSFTLGATALGVDGSFTAWSDPLAQYFGILAALTAASTGAVFIHNAAGPIMTEISQKASDLIRQKRGTYIELARSVGMMSSFAFPFLATSMLGMDWSAPFVLALPIVAASALGLNLAKLPNSKPVIAPAPKLVQSPVMDGARKPRKAMQWKNSILNNSYVRLLREEPGIGNFIGGLFAMNAVEVAFQSGFLFMIPKLTANESDQYLFGMLQYAVAFLAGRYLAGHFLKWFPNHNISVATLLSAIGGTAALGFTGDAYGLTAALFTAELGISTAFTLAFARTAKNHLTQDRVTSLIMASAVACAVGPVVLTQVAEGLINAGIMNESSATIAALIAIPSALAFMSAKLFKNMEGGSLSSLKTNLTALWAKVKAYFRK